MTTSWGHMLVCIQASVAISGDWQLPQKAHPSYTVELTSPQEAQIMIWSIIEKVKGEMRWTNCPQQNFNGYCCFCAFPLVWVKTAHFVSLKAQPVFNISTICNFQNNIIQCPKILSGTDCVQRVSLFHSSSRIFCSLKFGQISRGSW